MRAKIDVLETGDSILVVIFLGHFSPCALGTHNGRQSI